LLRNRGGYLLLTPGKRSLAPSPYFQLPSARCCLRTMFCASICCAADAPDAVTNGSRCTHATLACALPRRAACLPHLLAFSFLHCGCARRRGQKTRAAADVRYRRIQTYYCASALRIYHAPYIRSPADGSWTLLQHSAARALASLPAILAFHDERTTRAGVASAWRQRLTPLWLGRRDDVGVAVGSDQAYYIWLRSGPLAVLFPASASRLPRASDLHGMVHGMLAAGALRASERELRLRPYCAAVHYWAFYLSFCVGIRQHTLAANSALRFMRTLHPLVHTFGDTRKISSALLPSGAYFFASRYSPAFFAVALDPGGRTVGRWRVLPTLSTSAAATRLEQQHQNSRCTCCVRGLFRLSRRGTSFSNHMHSYRGWFGVCSPATKAAARFSVKGRRRHAAAPGIFLRMGGACSYARSGGWLKPHGMAVSMRRKTRTCLSSTILRRLRGLALGTYWAGRA